MKSAESVVWGRYVTGCRHVSSSGAGTGCGRKLTAKRVPHVVRAHLVGLCHVSVCEVCVWCGVWCVCVGGGVWRGDVGGLGDGNEKTTLSNKLDAANAQGGTSPTKPEPGMATAMDLQNAGLSALHTNCCGMIARNAKKMGSM